MYGALLEEFAGGEHARFVSQGGRPLRPRMARALALANLRPGVVVVDVGCGRGEALLHVARRGGHGIGVDFSVEGLALARRTLALAGQELPAAHLVAGDAGHLPVGDGCADRVLLLDVIEHLSPARVHSCLGEIRRILRPGGYVVIHTLPNWWALALYRAVAWAIPGLPTDPRSDYERLVHVNEQSPRSLRRALEASGLEARVWIEEWTTRHARRRAAPYRDRPRRLAYPLLGGRFPRWLGRALMGSPAAPVAGNDIFALAWAPGGWRPPLGGRFQRVR